MVDKGPPGGGDGDAPVGWVGGARPTQKGIQVKRERAPGIRIIFFVFRTHRERQNGKVLGAVVIFSTFAHCIRN